MLCRRRSAAPLSPGTNRTFVMPPHTSNVLPVGPRYFPCNALQMLMAPSASSRAEHPLQESCSGVSHEYRVLLSLTAELKM